MHTAAATRCTRQRPRDAHGSDHAMHTAAATRCARLRPRDAHGSDLAMRTAAATRCARQRPFEAHALTMRTDTVLAAFRALHRVSFFFALPPCSRRLTFSTRSTCSMVSSRSFARRPPVRCASIPGREGVAKSKGIEEESAREGVRE
eukprot:1851032-Pleurochrysis_carterae.AAC.2